jgi:hypothetical protein
MNTTYRPVNENIPALDAEVHERVEMAAFALG